MIQYEFKNTVILFLFLSLVVNEKDVQTTRIYCLDWNRDEIL